MSDSFDKLNNRIDKLYIALLLLLNELRGNDKLNKSALNSIELILTKTNNIKNDLTLKEESNGKVKL